MSLTHQAEAFCQIKLKINNKYHCYSAMIDTGNRVGNGFLISERFAIENSIQFHPIKPKPVGCAHEEIKLEIVGQVLKLQIILGRQQITVPVVYVLRSLACDINLGSNFIKQNKIIIDYSLENPELQIGNSRVPLILQVQEDSSTDRSRLATEEMSKYQASVSTFGKSCLKDNDIVKDCSKSIDNVYNKFDQTFVHSDPQSTICYEKKDCSESIDNNCSKLNEIFVHSDPQSTGYDGKFSKAVRVDGKLYFSNGKRLKPNVKKPFFIQQISNDEHEKMIVKKCTILKPNAMNAIEIENPRFKTKGVNSIFLAEFPISGCQEINTVEGLYPVRESTSRVLVMNTLDYPQVLKKGFVFEVQPTTTQQVKNASILQMTEEDDIKLSTNEEVNMERLYTELKIEKNSLLKDHPSIKKKLKSLIYKYRNVFSQDESVGHTNLVQCEVRLKEGTKPVRQKDRPMNPKLEESLKIQVDKWIQQKIVEPSQSPWSSPLVPIRKKDGSIRWATDLRILNKYIVNDSFPLPRIQQLLERAGGHKIYSSIDATSAYYSIEMAPNSKECTAFSTPFGLFHWNRMPFGISVAPAIYSRFIMLVLNPLGTKNLAVYLDDVLIFNNSMKAHLARLEEVLEAHARGGIKIKPAKTELFVEKIQYLGHQLSQDGIGMVPEYVSRIMEWPEPKNIKELNTLCGFLSYYREYIPNFSKLLSPLNQQKKSKKLDWTVECSQNLKELKKMFQEKPIRSVPDYSSKEPFILTTDYSGTALSAILSQNQGGKERLIAAGGRKCTAGESNYASWKGELAALVYGVRKFHHILSYKKFLVVTDNTALKYLTTLKQVKGITARWIEELSGLSFEVQHRPGKLNKNADALSRATHLPKPSIEEEEQQQSYVYQVQLEELNRDKIRKHQVEDDVLEELRKWLSNGRPARKEDMKDKPLELCQLRQLVEQIRIAEDGILEIELPDTNGEQKSWKILVPDSLKKQVFQWCHEHPSAGHFGVMPTLARQRRNFFYPGQRTDVTNRVKICGSCVAKERKINLKEGVHHAKQAGYPLQVIYIDLVGPMTESHQGFKYILTIEDGYSRFVNAYPLKTKETQEVARVLHERFISNFGCPVQIMSDNGKEFTSTLFKDLMTELQIKKTEVPPYCPQGNIVERFHRTLNTYMRVMMDREDSQWYKHLPALVLAYNSKVNVSTGVTPYLAFLGREVRLPVDLMVKLPRTGNDKTIHENVRTMLDRTKTVYQYIQRNSKAIIRRNAHQYTGEANKWKSGDLVWYLTPRRILGKPEKITNQWLGPFKVIQQVSDMMLNITPVLHPGKTYTVHRSRIRAYHGSLAEAQLNRMPTDLRIDDEDNLEAEEIRPQHSYSRPELGIPINTPTNSSIPAITERSQEKESRDTIEEAEINAPEQMTDPTDMVMKPEEDAESEEDKKPEEDKRSEEDRKLDLSIQAKVPSQKRILSEEESYVQPDLKKMNRKGIRRRLPSSLEVKKKTAKLLDSSSSDSDMNILT